MENSTGATKQAFLNKMKALIIAAYDGNLGENRSFTVQINSNECGDIDVKYHVCESADPEDEVTIGDLAKTSVWKKHGPPLPEKTYISWPSITLV